MRIFTETLQGTLESVVETINRLGFDWAVMSLQRLNEFQVAVVYRITDYQQYLWFCEKRGVAPLSTKDYFNGEQETQHEQPQG